MSICLFTGDRPRSRLSSGPAGGTNRGGGRVVKAMHESQHIVLNYERHNPVKSLIRNGVISGMGCQVRVRCMRRVWCAVVGEGVGGNGKYYRCRMGEWSSSRFFVNMDMY